MLIGEKQLALSCPRKVGRMWSSIWALRIGAGRSQEPEINVEFVGDSKSCGRILLESGGRLTGLGDR